MKPQIAWPPWGGRARRALAGALLASTAALVAVLAFVWWPLPPALLAPAGTLGRTIEDRHGLTLRTTRATDGTQVRWVPYSRLDPDLINAFVAVEDRRFWDHSGVDVRAVGRAMRDNLRARRIVSGASTITMQLARVLRPAERSWGGKLTQALWALRIERHSSKQEILEQYLNRVELGQSTAGVGAAAALYFDAAATQVSVGQAATLAGLAHAPSRDNPYASPTRARSRRLHALRRMRRLGLATTDDVDRARAEPLIAARRTPPFLAPHFTTRVLGWLDDERASATAHANVRTSLDLDLQGVVETEVRYTVDLLRSRGVEHAAVVVLDNASGEVLAWVGSPDFWAPRDGQTDMVVSPRQPGSALKPFLYGLALDRGFTAASVLPDIPRAYATVTGAYTPRNYDRRFRGPVRAREALASSYNVPAVELVSRLGTGSLLQTLHLAGFASLDREAEHYGLGLALGNGDVTLLELANGYRALANGGLWRPWSWRPTAASAQRDARTERVISPVASAIVLDMLSDASARIPGFGTSTPFDFPFPAAVKTGTSRHFTDNWSVATTRNFTVAVWAGNFSGRPMQGVSGVTGAGPLLSRVVMETARRYPPGVLTTPADAGAVALPVCRLSGMRATPDCAQLTEWFARGTEPSRADDWERAGVVTLPEEYAEWSRQEVRAGSSGVTLAGGPAGTRTLAEPVVPESPTSARVTGTAGSSRATVPRFRIVSPLDGDRYSIPAGIDARYATISLRAVGGGATVRWSIDGAAYSKGRWALAVGEHVFRAVSARGDTSEARVTVVP